MLTEKHLKKLNWLLKQNKTIVLSYQKSKKLLHIKEMEINKINLDSINTENKEG